MLNLVTGGSGFFGSHLAEFLLSRSEQVRVLDTVSPDLPGIETKLEWIQGDLRDPAAVANACQGVDVIYHSAALVPLSKAKRDFFEVNVKGTENLARAAVHFKIKKIVHLSSSAVYGIPKKLPVTEKTPLAPLGDYARSKYEAERVYEKYPLDVTIIRPRTVVGRRRLGIFQILYEWVRNGNKIWILGKGTNQLQLLSAPDLARASWLCAQRQGRSLYNIGAERFGSIAEDLQTLIDHAATGSRLVRLPSTPARALLRLLDSIGKSPLVDWHYLTFDKDLYFDLEKANRGLGWKSEDSNESMLIDSYDWYVRQTNRMPRGFRHREAPHLGWLTLLDRI